MKDLNTAGSKDLTPAIRERIKGKVALVGIGNILRGDDGLGPKLIELIRPYKVNAALFDCGTAPENYILPILSTNADTIIFVDASDSGSAPGEISILNLEEISWLSFSTHSPSPRLFIDLLKTGRDDLDIFFISIKPKDTTLGQGLTEEVKASLDFLRSALVEVLA